MINFIDWIGRDKMFGIKLVQATWHTICSTWTTGCATRYQHFNSQHNKSSSLQKLSHILNFGGCHLYVWPNWSSYRYIHSLTVLSFPYFSHKWACLQSIQLITNISCHLWRQNNIWNFSKSYYIFLILCMFTSKVYRQLSFLSIIIKSISMQAWTNLVFNVLN